MQVNVGNLPVWMGPQDKPGFITLPFTLGIERGLVRLILPPADLQRITDEYGNDAYGFITSPPGTSGWGNRLGDWYFNMLAKQVGSLTGKRVLEVGSGTLYIAEKVVRELGAESFIACDPALRDKTDLPNIEVYRQYFTWERFKDRPIDLVLSINTLEHIPDPFAHLTEIRRLLEPNNGTFFVVIPDCTRGFRAGDVGICVHEHLSYFTPETLTNVLMACGFVVTWIHNEEDTIIATAHPGQAAAPESDLSHVSEEFLTIFEAEFRRKLDMARQLIDEHRQKRLAIHGCSVNLNNTLALLGIQSDPHITLFDGDSNKVGKYLPAFDTPIRASTDEVYRTMDAVIVSAMTYYDEIAKFLVSYHGIPADKIYPIVPPN